MGIRFYNLNGFFVKKLAHGVYYENNHKGGIKVSPQKTV